MDIPLVQPAAMDQPRINAMIRLDDGTGNPLPDPLSYEDFFNFEAFYDTGASGIMLSPNTAGLLGVPNQTWYNPATGTTDNVTFRDVGVVGAGAFNVSTPLHISLAPYHPDTDVSNPATWPTVYSHTFGPVRAQLTPPSEDPNPITDDLDVIGAPAMLGKVVVMDPRPVNTFVDTIRTYVYNPGTPYDPANETTNPGIPTTTRHVKLSYANFAPFTSTIPSADLAPTMADNPFIGPNPILARMPNPPADNTPPITVGYNGKTISGSWLLDTGAAASIISKPQALSLGVSYVTGTEGTDNPLLSGVPVDQQFQLSIGGVGGTTKLAGFFLDWLVLPTEEGDPHNLSDPNHFRFIKAPVLVGNVNIPDPTDPTNPAKMWPLDGIFGMNFLVASANLIEGDPPAITGLTSGAFDWIVYDQTQGKLGLTLHTAVVTRASITWAALAGEENYQGWLTIEFSPITDIFVNNETAALQSYHDGDRVTFDDSSEVTTVNIFGGVSPDSVIVNASQDYTFTASFFGQISGAASLTKQGTGTLTIETENDYTGPTTIMGGKVILAAQQNIGDVTLLAGTSLEMQTSQQFRVLSIADATAQLIGGGKKVLVVKDMQFFGTGTLDLVDNDAVVHCDADQAKDTLHRLCAAIGSARNSGATLWQGPGLTTSAAGTSPTGLMTLGIAINDRGDGTTLMDNLDGESVGPTDILIKYTWNGDADLNGIVDANDYFAIDQGFRTGGATWPEGDFNYDGVVNADDYYLIDRSFVHQTGQLAASAAMAVSLPEPGAALTLVGMGVVLGRRRRGKI